MLLNFGANTGILEKKENFLKVLRRYQDQLFTADFTEDEAASLGYHARCHEGVDTTGGLTAHDSEVPILTPLGAP